MHDTLTTATRPYDADSPLAHLLNMVQALGRPTQDEQREDAVTAVARYVYPDTLAKVLDFMGGNGSPALRSPASTSRRPRRPGWTAGCGCTAPRASARPTARSTCSL